MLIIICKQLFLKEFLSSFKLKKTEYTKISIFIYAWSCGPWGYKIKKSQE